MNITISQTIKEVCPQLQLAIITGNVSNPPTSPALWAEMEQVCNTHRKLYQLNEINQRPAIAATRKVYKALGKDPNRYRPSAEALCRRIARNMPLYKVSTLVDIINLVSVQSGYSIGGFDADKISGDIHLGVGVAAEPFEAIGRGILNIEGLPVFRDALGGIGTPTSDNERTKLSEDTRRLLIIINGYCGRSGLDEMMYYTGDLLIKYAEGTDIRYDTI